MYILVLDDEINLFFNKKEIARVDIEDFPLVTAHRWSLLGGYVVTTIAGKLVSLHRLICPVGEGMVVDHINRDRLDNRRCNLRPATRLENIQNHDGWHEDFFSEIAYEGNIRRASRQGSSSRFKGVSWCATKRRWRATLWYESAQRLSKYSRYETHAALTYNRAARKFHGRWAYQNPVTYRDYLEERKLVRFPFLAQASD